MIDEMIWDEIFTQASAAQAEGARGLRTKDIKLGYKVGVECFLKRLQKSFDPDYRNNNEED